MNIRSISALEVLDSRGNPTVSTDIYLENGSIASALVPSGASTGEREAMELRDGDIMRYRGKGVQKAIRKINTEINDALTGFDVTDQEGLDKRLIELDGTPNKSRLGANSILGVSMAAARAGAAVSDLPLYRYLGGNNANILPVPCLNIINGGRHADNTIDFQEFQIAPHNASSFSEAIHMAIETFHTLKDILTKHGKTTGVGDEGGFVPNFKKNQEALDWILQAIEKAGFRPGKDIALCLDPATSEMWKDGHYVFFKSNHRTKTTAQMIDLWISWLDAYPIVLIEDALAENDWGGWQKMTNMIGDKIELVGDDIFCTNLKTLQRAIDDGVANSILIKPNQIGTVSETLECVRLAQKNGYGVYVSHRSGETEDTFIADLAVATGCGHIKTGSGCRSERVSKFNRLLRIEHELGDTARFAGISGFKQTMVNA